jgi:hypothetical protein
MTKMNIFRLLTMPSIICNLTGVFKKNRKILNYFLGITISFMLIEVQSLTTRKFRELFEKV